MPVKTKLKDFAQLVRKYLNYLLFAANLIAMLCMYLATQAGGMKGSEYPIIAYLGLLFPIILTANILFTIFWLFTRRWKFLVVQLLAFIIVWSPLGIYYPLHLKQSVPDDVIKILSYNVRGLNWLTGEKARKNPILTYAANSKADIINPTLIHSYFISLFYGKGRL